MSLVDPFNTDEIRAHRAAAIKFLRELVDDDEARPSDRSAAARDLAKLINDLPSTSREERRALEMSDDELLEVIHAARARREGATPAPPTPGVALSKKGPNPQNAGGSPGGPTDPASGAQTPGADAFDAFAAALADVPNLPDYDLAS